jgi:hypothetical protein
MQLRTIDQLILPASVPRKLSAPREGTRICTSNIVALLFFEIVHLSSTYFHSSSAEGISQAGTILTVVRVREVMLPFISSFIRLDATDVATLLGHPQSSRMGLGLES